VCGLLFVLVLAGCRTPAATRAASAESPVDDASLETTRASAADDVSLDTAQAEAVLEILSLYVGGQEPGENHWKKLRDTVGYQQLRRRELSMNREFSDEAFERFLQDPAMAEQLKPLRAALSDQQRAGITRPLELARAYLPEGTPIRATIFPVIKPMSNSFVFEGDKIFLYIDPERSAAQVQNILAHELHHIGLSAACAIDRDPDDKENLAHQFASGFGEGFAVLAAAGGAEHHPHSTSPTSDRERWDRDLARRDEDLKTVERFLMDLAEGKITTAEEAMKVAAPFWGEQGAWYTVGWSIAAKIEQELGRGRLVANLCDPASLFEDYNRVADPSSARFSTALIDKLRGPTADAADATERAAERH
jgi:hypothetical protein